MEALDKTALVQPTKLGQADDNGTMFVAFSIGSEEFGVNALTVREIKTRTEITRVPSSRGYIKGVVNLRGKIIPVFSVSEQMSIATNVDDQKTIVFIESSRGDAGLLVDKVTDVITLLDTQIEDNMQSGSNFGSYSIGTGKVGSRLITLIDSERILGIND